MLPSLLRPAADGGAGVGDGGAVVSTTLSVLLVPLKHQTFSPRKNYPPSHVLERKTVPCEPHIQLRERPLLAPPPPRVAPAAAAGSRR